MDAPTGSEATPLRLFALVGVAWAALAVALSPGPFARTAVVVIYAGAWVAQAARPVRLGPPVVLVSLGFLLVAPPGGGPGGFRPFPFAEGTFADGALAVAAAPVWVHLAVLARVRDLVWAVPLGLALAPLRQVVAGGAPLWPTWILWGAGWLLVGLIFRLHGMLYEARSRLDREAVAEERRKIAREVHDLVGHGLGVALLNITAARMAVARGDSAAAVGALAEAERAGRQGVRDVHRGLVLLRDPRPAEGIVPAPPTAEDVGALVGEVRAGGLAVELRARGDLSGVDPAVGLAIYRVVQEALSNTARHAPGAPANVTVEVGEVARVTVVDPGSGAGRGAPGGGLGLVGMRERVTALGGTLRAGASGAGWTVEATIPLGRGAR